MLSAERIFERALQRPPRARAAYVRRACAGNRALQAELRSLLDAHARFPELLVLPTATPWPGSLRGRTAPAGAGAPGGRASRKGSLVGSTLGAFRVLSELGRGGMGVVYLARDGRDGRRVALKVLPESRRGDPRRRGRLRAEARLLAGVNHPAVAAVLGWERHAGADVLVLEYVPGPTLAERLADGPLRAGESLRVGRGIASALEAAHGRGVAHLDLKPENVVLPPAGGVKVLDFGLARAVLPGVVRARRRDAGPRLVRGTPGYASPEQLCGRPGDARSDLFSFGCVFYECWTGRPAFPGGTIEERMAATLAVSPDWNALPDDIPAGVRRLLASCLSRDPGRRPPGATLLRRTLEEEISRGALPEARVADPGSTAATNLPVPIDSFVGRAAERRELLRLLARRRLVTLTGPGGAGKSRLALQVGRSILLAPAGRPAPAPDGIWLVELAGAPTVAAALHAIAVVLGVRERRGRSVRRSLLEELAGRRALLILDNCEHLPPTWSRFLEALLEASAGIRLLVTSRCPLACRHEEVVRLAPLPVPPSNATLAGLRANPAAGLFLDRARTAEPSFRLEREDGAVLAEICRRLDGLPLALELAAARVAALSLRRIAQQVRAATLTPAVEADTAGRHRTLQDLVAWSERLLPPAERRLLRRVAVFHGPFTLAGVEALGTGEGVRAWETFDLLSALVRSSLVEIVPAPASRAGAGNPPPVRYRLLEVVRRYALRRLSRSGESAAVRRRHRDHFLELAREAARHARGPEQGAWLERLEAARDDLRAALEWSARRDPGGPGPRLAASLAWFWSLRGHWTEGSRLLAAVIAAARAASRRRGGPRGRSREEAAETERAQLHAVLWLGNLAFNRGALAQAETCYRQVLRGARRRDILPLAGSALLNLGAAAILRGDLPRARAALEEAIPVHRRIGDPGELATLYLNLGVVAEREQALGRAARLYARSLALRQRQRDPWSVARSLNNLGVVAEKRGRLGEAARLHGRALRTRRRLGDRRGIAETLHNLAAVEARRGRLAAAGRRFAESLSVRLEIGDEIGLIGGLEAVASVFARRHPEMSAALLAHADAQRRRIRFVPSPTTRQERASVDGVLAERLSARERRAEAERGRKLSAPEAVARALQVCRRE